LFGDGLFAPTVVSDELLALTGDMAWLQALLDAEAGLVRAEADIGIVPPEAAEVIAGCCHATAFDVAGIGDAARAGGNPVIPLVVALTARVPAPARTWVHWGATSQDILDTAAMLVAERSLVVIDRELQALASGCATLAERHRHTLMAGRTLLQQALPITFGAKAAGWLLGVVDVRRLVSSAPTALPWCTASPSISAWPSRRRRGTQLANASPPSVPRWRPPPPPPPRSAGMWR
jgi:3-carboxy-cis,cis-muconate cycloisomerase